jgi:hypothetical protein
MLSSPMSSILPQEVEDFWSSRWSQNSDFYYDSINQLFPIKEVFNQELNERVIMQLLDLEAMVAIFSKRSNLSAPVLDGITFPLLKLSKDSVARIIIEMIRFMIFHKKIPNIWKMGKTILIHKASDLNDPGNWRSIALTSVIDRIIFGKMAQVMMSNENRSVRRGLLSLSQKGFVPRVNECGEHIAMENMTINRGMTTHKILNVQTLEMLMFLDLFLISNFWTIIPTWSSSHVN